MWPAHMLNYEQMNFLNFLISIEVELFFTHDMIELIGWLNEGKHN